MRLRQDPAVLTQLGQLSAQAVAVPGNLVRHTDEHFLKKCHSVILKKCVSFSGRSSF